MYMNQEEEKTVEEIGRLLEKLSPIDQAVILQRADSYLMEQTGVDGGGKRKEKEE